MYLSIVVFVLTKALFTELCHALNVTVTPGPVVLVMEKDNLTLSCLVSQRKRNSSVLILRWFFSPLILPSSTPPSSVPATSSPAFGSSQFLIVRIGIRKLKLYGNYTRKFPQPKFHLHDEEGGEEYQLLILNVTGMDQGFYSCKVQEIRKFRDTWRSSSNGSSTVQLRVHLIHEDVGSVALGSMFADLYVCVVLICSLGLLSIFLFTIVLSCQYFHRRHRLKASYLLVRCPESSSGETVTSSSSCSSSSPRASRKENGAKAERIKALPHLTPPELPKEPPIYIPPKVPIAAKRPQKPKRSKARPKKCATPQEESLTYAELELVRPRPEPPCPISPAVTTSNPDTVYAQILFKENKL